MIKYIPYPVTMGFTSGIAVLIFSTQIKDFFGLQMEKVPSEFRGEDDGVGETRRDSCNGRRWRWRRFRWRSSCFGRRNCSAGCRDRLWRCCWERLAVALFQLPVETIGSKFGGIPQGLPSPRIPTLSWENIRHLFAPATTIALLAAIESLLCAVVADGMTDDRHDSNQELMAQGLANIVAPLFGGIAATSAIARTATNVKCGARTPVAGIIHAVNAAGDHPGGGAAGEVHSAGDVERGAGERGPEHGRVAQLPPAGQVAAERCRRCF